MGLSVRRVEGGRFSSFANADLKAGDELDVMTPMGRFFTTLDSANEKHYVAFAAGSGITPVISIHKGVLYAEPKSRFTLFYGNRKVASIIFREELEGLKNRFMERLSVHHILSRESLDNPLFRGRIDAEKAGDFCRMLLDPKEVDEFFLCGPYPMLEAVTQALRSFGVDKRSIHQELSVTVTLDGNTFAFSMMPGAGSILEAAQQLGADLPYACKGGVCSTCRARLEEGAVDMAVNYALEDDELEAGYILTCQAFPKTEKVKVNFDV